MDIVELIEASHGLLRAGRVRHAFGGALSLAYYAEPRATLDVDINVFVPEDGAAGVIARFSAIGLEPELAVDEWIPIGGIRLVPAHGPARLDLFPSVDQRYDEIWARRRRFPFGSGGVRLPFLAPEDLVLFKLSFGRDKDWVDLASMARAGTVVDMDVVEDLLIGLRGPSLFPRVARARALFDR